MPEVRNFERCRDWLWLPASEFSAPGLLAHSLLGLWWSGSLGESAPGCPWANWPRQEKVTWLGEWLHFKVMTTNLQWTWPSYSGISIMSLFSSQSFIVFLPIPHKDDWCPASHTAEKIEAIKGQFYSLHTETLTSLPVLSHHQHSAPWKPIAQNDSKGEWQLRQGHWCSGLHPWRCLLKVKQEVFATWRISFFHLCLFLFHHQYLLYRVIVSYKATMCRLPLKPKSVYVCSSPEILLPSSTLPQRESSVDWSGACCHWPSFPVSSQSRHFLSSSRSGQWLLHFSKVPLSMLYLTSIFSKLI